MYGPGVEGCGHSGFPEDEDSPWEVVDHHVDDQEFGLSLSVFLLASQGQFFMSSGFFFGPCRQPSTAFEIL